jgi:hypothetical protein
MPGYPAEYCASLMALQRQGEQQAPPSRLALKNHCGWGQNECPKAAGLAWPPGPEQVQPVNSLADSEGRGRPAQKPERAGMPTAAAATPPMCGVFGQADYCHYETIFLGASITAPTFCSGEKSGCLAQIQRFEDV